MARMSLDQLNDLLQRALHRMQSDGLTLVNYQDDPFKPWLPEEHWRRKWDEAAEKAAELFEQSLVIAQRKMERQAEDRKLANTAVADLMDEWDEALPTLQGPSEVLAREGWGRMRMYQTGLTKPPTLGSQQPEYPWQCYQCGRPITDDGRDHAGRTRCDHALMDPADCYPDHQPKPIHGEEEEEEGW